MRLRTADVASRTVDGEIVILDLRTSRYLTVNGVGARIVEMLADDVTLDEVVGCIVDEYEVDDDVARNDAQGFISKLRAAGLLED